MDVPVTDFILVAVTGTAYAQKWKMQGKPLVYKMAASRYAKTHVQKYPFGCVHAAVDGLVTKFNCKNIMAQISNHLSTCGTRSEDCTGWAGNVYWRLLPTQRNLAKMFPNSRWNPADIHALWGSPPSRASPPLLKIQMLYYCTKEKNPYMGTDNPNPSLHPPACNSDQMRVCRRPLDLFVASGETAPVKGQSHRVSVVYFCNNTSGREQGG
jgi:hypothetical protein